MEPYSKRQRLYSPVQRDFAPTYTPRNDYYNQDDELGFDEDQLDEVLDYSPHTELQQRRAQLDRRLKGTFESIFEKYGRDFEGVGDEIDLATGEIIVNNGHLEDMANERDAGHLARKLSTEEEVSSSTEGYQSLEDREGPDEEEGAYSEEGDDEDEDEDTTGDSMDDDDLILRGFAQANRFLQASPDLGAEFEAPVRPAIPRPSHRNLDSNPISAHSDLVAQFGPQLGAQIAKYISQQEKIQADRHIEPAWRVPELPSSSVRKHPARKYTVPLPQIERSPSPEASTSVWAIPSTTRRRKTEGRHSADVFDSLPRVIQSRKKRTEFTDEDDQILLEWVARARQRGSRTNSTIVWEGLATKYPRHPAASWLARYRNNFMGQTRNTGSSQSASDEADDSRFRQRSVPKSYPQEKPDTLPAISRPSRIRKPAQRDSRIISWSEAVDKIAISDPHLYAGILRDTHEENSDEDWSVEHPALSVTRQLDQQSHLSLSKSIPHSQLAEAQCESVQSQPPPARDHSSSSRHVFMATSSPSAHPTAPCPHSECRHYVDTLYRLQRKDDEEYSPMTFHLLRVHKTTPFPCGEFDCSRKGENGYFIQEDLVKHVKQIHPYLTALQRLRGRVDPDLLLPKSQIMQRKSIPSLALNRPQSSQHHSKLISPRPTGRPRASSDSSTPGFDRILTPNGLGRNAGEANTTPLTSVSSLQVNQSSSTSYPSILEIRDSQEPVDTSVREFTQQKATTPRKATTCSQSGIELPVSQHDRSKYTMGATRAVDAHLKIREVEINTRPVARKNRRPANSDIVDPIPVASLPQGTPRSQETITSYENTQAHQSETQEHSLESQVSFSESVPSDSTTIPNKETSFENRSFNSTPLVQGGTIPEHLSPKEVFFKNVVDPSHEFSDDEEEFSIPTAKHFTASMLPPSAFIVPPLELPATPRPKAKAHKPIIRPTIRQEDIDELSLGADDFAIISSNTRAVPLPAFGATPAIKREGTVGPRLASVAPSRKRKHVEVQADDEVDELGADECFGKSTGPQTRVKKEVDLNTTPMVHRVKAKRTMRLGTEAERGLTNFSSSVHRNLDGRAATPLLDLTPDRPRTEIPSSGGLRNQRAVEVSSPMDGFVTPTHSKRWNGDLSATKTIPLVFKTPGGSYRQCGDGHFTCRRSFCFRCSGTPGGSPHQAPTTTVEVNMSVEL